MAASRLRTIVYLKTRWRSPVQGRRLQGVLGLALSALPNVSDTVRDCLDGDAAVLDRDDTGAILLHVAQWSNGARTSTVPHPEDVTEQSLAVLPPEDTYNFLNGDGTVLVSGDDVLMIGSSELRIPTIGKYLRSLLRKAVDMGVLSNDDLAYEIAYLADPDVMKTIDEDGIKSVRFHLKHYFQRGLEEQHVGSPVSHMRMLTAAVMERTVLNPSRRTTVFSAANVYADVTLGISGNQVGLLPDALTDVAEDALRGAESEDEIELVTGSGGKYKRGQLALSKRVPLPPHGKTVSRRSAWQALIKYLQELDGVA